MKWRFINTVLFIISLLVTMTSAWGNELPAEDVQAIMLHEGEYASVIGTVVSTHIAKSGKVRFLNFGPDYRKAFTVVIFTSDLDKFMSKIGEPTKYYLNKKVKVDGRIKIYQEKPEIIANNPSQIEIIGQ
jgi:hypothetical protein